MPHCSRFLYESILLANFSPALGRPPARVILGNDLAEYTGFVRPDLIDPSLHDQSPQTAEPEFHAPKKKRKGKTFQREVKDGVLERLGMLTTPFDDPSADDIVPHMSIMSLSKLPETNLPGFARAFLSLAFQWLPEEAVGLIDWEKSLPPIVVPDDGEVVGI